MFRAALIGLSYGFTPESLQDPHSLKAEASMSSPWPPPAGVLGESSAGDHGSHTRAEQLAGLADPWACCCSCLSSRVTMWRQKSQGAGVKAALSASQGPKTYSVAGWGHKGPSHHTPSLHPAQRAQQRHLDVPKRRWNRKPLLSGTRYGGCLLFNSHPPPTRYKIPGVKKKKEQSEDQRQRNVSLPT